MSTNILHKSYDLTNKPDRYDFMIRNNFLCNVRDHSEFSRIYRYVFTHLQSQIKRITIQIVHF